MSDLKNRLESILFASGKPLNVEELSRLTKERDLEVVRKALEELKKELDEKQGSVMLVNEKDEWKLSVREKYLPFVRKIVTKTELPKTIIETLAIVAFKAPVLQSKVIHIRTNKAYRHLDFLEEKGYITREKKGRTKLIKLTQKFFEYFDVPPEKLKEKFVGFEELDKAIEEVEQPKEIDLVDEEGHKIKLKEYDTEPEVEAYKETPSPVEEYVEKVDGLETYGEKKERKKRKHKKEKKKEEYKEEKKKEEKKEAKPEKAEPEEEVEPPTEEELAAALSGEEPQEIKKEAEKAEEEAEKVEEVAEEAKEEAEKIKEGAEKVEEKAEEKEKKAEPKKKDKKKKEKKEKKDTKAEPKEKNKKKKEEKEEKPEEEIKKEPEKPREKITERSVREKAKKLAEESAKAPPEYETEGIFKGEIPKHIKEKIEKRAEEIVYGEKQKIEEEKKEEITAEEKPKLETEEKKEITEEKKEKLPKKEKTLLE